MIQALDELKDIISYNVRKLRFDNCLSHETLSDKADITTLTLFNCETGKHIGLDTLLKLCIYYKINLADITKDKPHQLVDEDLRGYRKMPIVSDSLIPQEYKFCFRNFCATDAAKLYRTDYITWYNILEYKGMPNWKSLKIFKEKLSDLVIGDSFLYDHKNHLKVYSLIFNNESFTLRQQNGKFNCTKIA